MAKKVTTKDGRVIVKGKNPKNKKLINTKVKNIPRSVVKKVRQKVKNVGNQTPTQLAKRFGRTVINQTKVGRAVKAAKRIAKKLQAKPVSGRAGTMASMQAQLDARKNALRNKIKPMPKRRVKKLPIRKKK
tara:strand:- start:3971 stop:4363 length:393 start_codon:yes stop_codon:yes gene_type:complete